MPRPSWACPQCGRRYETATSCAVCQPRLAGGASWLQDLKLRAAARAMRNVPVAPEERLAVFHDIGFVPYGLYLPDAPEARASLLRRVEALGGTLDPDARRAGYIALQAETAALEEAGVPGAWTGQQRITRSTARFRLASMGRRGGKTSLAAAEVIAQAKLRPRSVVWIAAPYMKHVARCFDMVVTLIQDLGLKTVTLRNSDQTKYVSLENGSVIEGVSLEKYKSAAGASVNFMVVDEVAQISTDAWVRALMPPLTDTGGHALLIGSWEGTGGFLFEQVQRVQAEQDPEWGLFSGVTWDNFFAFPQGERTPAIVHAKKTTPPLDFLEQYGAIPQRGGNLVYPQFKARVHVIECPFNPRWPVTIAVDPSKGANPYAVAVLQEDPLTHACYVIDEYYQAGPSAEQVCAELDRRPWRRHVKDGVMDNADPNEILRWQQAGFPVYAIDDKPKVEQRYPILRRLFLDPLRYYGFHQAKLQQVLEARGVDWPTYASFAPEEQAPYLVDLEEQLAESKLSDDDVAALQTCSHIFFNRATTPFCVKEIQEYVYAKSYLYDQNAREVGRKYKDHLCDALGYWAWVFKREDYLTSLDLDRNPLGLTWDAQAALLPTTPAPPRPEGALVGLATPSQRADGPSQRMSRFIDHVRTQYSPVRDTSYVLEVRD